MTWRQPFDHRIAASSHGRLLWLEVSTGGMAGGDRWEMYRYFCYPSLSLRSPHPKHRVKSLPFLLLRRYRATKLSSAPVGANSNSSHNSRAAFTNRGGLPVYLIGLTFPLARRDTLLTGSGCLGLIDFLLVRPSDCLNMLVSKDPIALSKCLSLGLQHHKRELSLAE